jgi:hypothetical protein
MMASSLYNIFKILKYPPITHMKVEQLGKQLPMHKVKYDKMSGNQIWNLWCKHDIQTCNVQIKNLKPMLLSVKRLLLKQYNSLVG